LNASHLHDSKVGHARTTAPSRVFACPGEHQQLWAEYHRLNSRTGSGPDWDIGVQKLLAIRGRHRLQLRADFLDAFNHFNLGSPSATIADTSDGGLPNATAGKVFGGSGNLIVQIGLKYMF
jgi:hypothetical protein